MASYSTSDYAFLAKSGFLLGASLFVLGVLGSFILPAVLGSIPEWEQTLFFYSEVVGTVIGFFSPLLFGLVFPLTS